LARSDLYADEHHWGDRAIDLTAHDLPALKARYLVRALPDRGRVVEIGCGSGRVLNTVARHRPHLELHGCDIRTVERPATFEFRVVDPDVPDLPYETNSVDVAILYDVLEHLHDPAASLAAAHRILRPGGHLISFTPLEGQPFSFYRCYRRVLGADLYLDTKEHIQAFSERSLLAIVEPWFRVVDREYAYHFIGHCMDATLFALMKIPAVRRRFWNENPYYVEGETAAGSTPSSFGRVLSVANALAELESRLLRHVRWGAAGLLFTAEAR
jgi:SAM-dependent methyltransferase